MRSAQPSLLRGWVRTPPALIFHVTTVSVVLLERSPRTERRRRAGVVQLVELDKSRTLPALGPQRSFEQTRRNGLRPSRTYAVRTPPAHFLEPTPTGNGAGSLIHEFSPISCQCSGPAYAQTATLTKSEQNRSVQCGELALPSDDPAQALRATVPCTLRPLLLVCTHQQSAARVLICLIPSRPFGYDQV